MTTTVYDLTKGFVLKFKLVKRLCANSPDRLQRLCELNAGTRTFVDGLLMDAMVLQSAFDKSARKYVKQVHAEFPELWEEYQNIWSAEISMATLSIVLDDVARDDDLSSAERRSALYQATDDTVYLEDFDPRWHVLSEALLDLIQYCRDKISYANAPEVDAILQLGVTAWDHLEKMGFDIREISTRCAKTPKIYVPKHVSDEHGASERRSLFRLLDEAGRAYYFGAPLAALAMCRTILELLLNRYYVPQHASYQLLGKKIEHAVRQHDWLCQENLNDKNDAAKNVLHEMTPKGQVRTLPENVDQQVQNFMMTLKRMIEKAPQPDSPPAESPAG